MIDTDYEGKPTEEEFATLRRVAGGVPAVAYLLCAVEFCERASYYGKQVAYRRGFATRNYTGLWLIRVPC